MIVYFLVNSHARRHKWGFYHYSQNEHHFQWTGFTCSWKRPFAGLACLYLPNEAGRKATVRNISFNNSSSFLSTTPVQTIPSRGASPPPPVPFPASPAIALVRADPPALRYMLSFFFRELILNFFFVPLHQCFFFVTYNGLKLWREYHVLVRRKQKKDMW